MKIEKTDKYIKVIAEDGHYLTSYKDGDDILNYAYATKQYSPLTYDITKLREITQEESDKLAKEQEQKIKELKEV